MTSVRSAPTHVEPPRHAGGWALWRRWVLANGAAEAVGLGFTAVVASFTIARDLSGALVLLAALAMLAAGAVEGIVVGTAQWLVLRRPLPAIPRRHWVIATVVGATVAWGLGMTPSTLAAGSPDAQGGMETVGTALQLVLAAGLGLVAGPVLAIPQWLVLRHRLARAWWWIPAHAVAWAAAMPVVFAVAGGVPQGLGTVETAVLVLGTLAAAGAVAGAIHGAVLVALLRRSPAARHLPT